MTAIAIRRSLQEYIRFADEKKIKALFTIVEDEINQKRGLWTKEFINDMKKRSSDFSNNKVKGSTRQSVQRKVQSILKNGK
jgi:hypothetical protein